MPFGLGEHCRVGSLARAFAGFIRALSKVVQTSGLPVDPEPEAQRLAALLDGLRLPVLIGALSYGDARAVVDRHLMLIGSDRHPNRPPATFRSDRSGPRNDGIDRTPGHQFTLDFH